VASKVRAGVLKGDRRSTKRGSSIEFADFRDYVPGDDLRRLDWNVYARLERPFIKLLEEEEDLAVHILLDNSKSMNWAPEEHNKSTFSRRLTAGLSAIALSTGDRLTIQFLQPPKNTAKFGPVRGQYNLLRVLKYLEGQPAEGDTNLNKSLRNYAYSSNRPGLIILLSDMFSPAGYQQGVTDLLSKGHELVIIQILSPDEIDPPLAGDLQLIDVETKSTQDVSLDAGIRRLYRQRVQDWQAEIQAFCNLRGIHFLSLSTAIPWDRFLLYDLRRVGVVK
jgi:uncharacterized protein (DUF58 family)